MLHLSEKDLQRWLDVITSQPKQAIHFLSWIESKIQAFFPFRSVFIAYGELVAGQIKTTHWLNVGHEARYLEQLSTTFELEKRGSLKWWFENRQPFTIDPKNPPLFATEFEVQEIEDFGLRNIAAHGVLNSRSNAGTYFSFTGVPHPLSDWHLDALRLLAPVLNDLYLAYITEEIKALPVVLDTLTLRQKCIVRHVVAGLDNKTVARQLGITEKTVRNQLTEIYSHLGIRKRTQLLTLFR